MAVVVVITVLFGWLPLLLYLAADHPLRVTLGDREGASVDRGGVSPAGIRLPEEQREDRTDDHAR
jgi:hypothetical protein